MKLADIEDADTLATKQDLQLLEHQLSDKFHKEIIGLIMWFVSIQVTIAIGILGDVYFMLSTMLTHWRP